MEEKWFLRLCTEIHHPDGRSQGHLNSWVKPLLLQHGWIPYTINISGFKTLHNTWPKKLSSAHYCCCLTWGWDGDTLGTLWWVTSPRLSRCLHLSTTLEQFWLLWKPREWIVLHTLHIYEKSMVLLTSWEHSAAKITLLLRKRPYWRVLFLN